MNNAVEFCEDLFGNACQQAQDRSKTTTQTIQLQMVDLLRAFNHLKLQKYAPHFAQIQGEWNEALALINAYTTAQAKLTPEKGLSIAQAIKKWHQYKKLPNEIQQAIEKAMQNYLHGYEVLNEKLQHFFDQLQLSASNLNDPEDIRGLVKQYRMQSFDVYHKQDYNEVNAVLLSLKKECNALLNQLEKPSREFTKLCQWIEQHLPTWTPSKEGAHKHPDGQTKPR